MMTKTTNRGFATEIVQKALSIERHYFVIESDSDVVTSCGQGKTLRIECKSPGAWFPLFEQSTGESTWISMSKERTEDLLRAATGYRASYHGSKTVFGNLLMLQSPRVESLTALSTVFRHVIGQVRDFKWLPFEEFVEVLLAPKEESRNLFIGGLYDPATDTLTLARGRPDTVVVPLSMFRPSGDATPDPSDFGVTDYGNTIRLGKYEASADAILYEVDPDYRRRINAKRREEDKGFGPSLRRLRIQRHLTRNDFPGVTAKTIARIERGEIAKPHEKTLSVLAETLGVRPDEIETY